MHDDEHHARTAQNQNRTAHAARDLAAITHMIRALERDLAGVPGLTHAASALAFAALEVEQLQRPQPLITSILKNRLRPRGRQN